MINYTLTCFSNKIKGDFNTSLPGVLRHSNSKFPNLITSPCFIILSTLTPS
ncbi:unnamed protein product [Schistosoma mattheei]|uniref:Uncharacterized protein n=1 Tax=Schistosoma mattheei TaxID=31246 RepID=A0A183P8Y0_9TREM|nr:unnamed protein product [Schistosoma mattheei]